MDAGSLRFNLAGFEHGLRSAARAVSRFALTLSEHFSRRPGKISGPVIETPLKPCALAASAQGLHALVSSSAPRRRALIAAGLFSIFNGARLVPTCGGGASRPVAVTGATRRPGTASTMSIVWTAAITAAVTAAVILVPLFGPGCAKRKPADLNPGVRLELASGEGKRIAGELPKAADRIDGHADQIERKTHGKVDVRPEVGGIKTETTNVRQLGEQLARAVVQLNTSRAEVATLTAQRDEARKQRDDLVEEEQSARRKLFGLLSVAMAVGLGISAALVALGNKAGIATGIGCAVTLAVSVAVGQYSFWLAIGGAVVFVGGLAYLVVRIRGQIREKQKLAAEERRLRRASVELAQSIEVVKDVVTVDERKQLTGRGAIPGLLAHPKVQSPETQDLVRQMKDRGELRLATPVTAAEDQGRAAA